MSGLSFYLIFTTIAIALYIPSRWSKSAFSGEHYTPAKYWLAVSYNMVLSFIHNRFVQTGKLPYIGYTDNSVMGWLSMVMMVLHLCSLPAPWLRRPWFKRRKFDPRFRRHKP